MTLESLVYTIPPLLIILFAVIIFGWAMRKMHQGDRFIKLRLAGVSTKEAERISGFKLPAKEEEKNG
jgi:hypothetical protein